jgi:hypothetical protein
VLQQDGLAIRVMREDLYGFHAAVTSETDNSDRE